MATHQDPNLSAYRPEIFSSLLSQYAATPVAELSKRWLLLEAAHVVGQTRLGPHLQTHLLMFGQARHDRDWHEAAGRRS